MSNIRPASEDDREEIAAVSGLSFNYVMPPEAVTIEGRLCAVDGGRVVATAGAIPFDQWFGGRCVPCAGVASVAVLPEHRGRRLATRLMTELLHQQSTQGRALSALYPTNATLYRSLGYEYAGVRSTWRAPIGDVTSTVGEKVREMSRDEVPEVMACFSKFCASHNGPVESADEAYFTARMLAGPREGTHQRTVVVQGAGGLEGYASYFTSAYDNDGHYAINVKHLVPLTAGALKGLLGYFSQFRNSAYELTWRGPPSGSLMGLALPGNGFYWKNDVLRWMGRLIDIPAALEGRGYPPLEANFVLEVEDALLPGNRGPWRVEVAGGRASVGPAGSGTRPATVMSSGALAALYSGHASADELVLAGALEPAGADLVALSTLFAGPAPWMQHFF